MSEFAEHGFGPVYDKNSRVLVLGSFPSVKSREQSFYYGHPQNRFWRLVSELFGEDMPVSVEEKKKLVLKHNIALYDVVESCVIDGSKDSSIKDVKPCDIKSILDNSFVKVIFANGKTAEKLYNKYTLKMTGVPIICLPSTSPANAACSFEKLLKEWDILKKEVNR